MSRDAWIDMVSEEQVRASRPSGGSYDFGFVHAMGRLLSSHPRIGPQFLKLFTAVMFEESHLSRRERELVAAIAAAGQDCFY